MRRSVEDAACTGWWAVAGWAIRKRRGRIQRVGLQRIVPEILIFPEYGVEAVPSVLAYPQARDIIGIAAVAEIAEIESVKKCGVVVQRAHLRGEIQQPGSLLQIHKGVVGLEVAA